MFHAEEWLDFNMVQSSHVRPHCPNYHMVTADYLRRPIKPCMDAEPCYEDHPLMGSGWIRQQGAWFDDLAVRQTAYWSVFAGAHGHTYGCHPVWQMYKPGTEPINGARRYWNEALQLPGAGQMQYLRKLLESRPFLTRIPDQSMLLSHAGDTDERIQATRDREGTYALIYFPGKLQATVAVSKLSGDKIRISWFDPRNGEMRFDAEVDAVSSMDFITPPGGPDWVLVLDAVY
jgi:hypothetical protein